jgi:membrane-associated phospholipid phosphatase
VGKARPAAWVLIRSAPVETDLLLWIHARATPLADAVFAASHYAGTLLAGSVVVLAACAAHLARGERRAALVWVLTGAAVYLVQDGLKRLVARPRPQLWERAEWAISPGSYAFPSGHALATAAFFTLAAHSLGRVWPRGRLAAAVAAAALVLWVGVGRLYLGVHWPSDVLAGWALGFALAVAAIRYVEAHEASAPHARPGSRA